MADALARPRPGALHPRTQPDPSLRRDAQRYDAGALLFAPGPADEVLQLVSGLVRLHALDEEGGGLTLRYVKPGGWFGEEAMVRRPRSLFAEAVTDVEVLHVPLPTLGPHERAAVAEHLAHALDDLYRALPRLARRPLRARVAAELLDLSDSALATRDGDLVAVRITHDALADSVGSVRETVTKVIGELSRAGAVDAGYGRVVVRDVERLRELADA
jgi:CRP-like cAMP-binding protein